MHDEFAWFEQWKKAGWKLSYVKEGRSAREKPTLHLAAVTAPVMKLLLFNQLHVLDPNKYTPE